MKKVGYLLLLFTQPLLGMQGGDRVMPLKELVIRHLLHKGDSNTYNHTQLPGELIEELQGCTDISGMLKLSPENELQGCNHAIIAIAQHPTKPFVAVGRADGTIVLWSLAEQSPINLSSVVQDRHYGKVCFVAFSQCGNYLVSGGEDRLVKVWDINACACVATLQGHIGALTSGLFSPCGQYVITGSHDKTVRCWDWRKKECIKIIRFDGNVYALTTDSVGKTIFIGSANYLHAWKWYTSNEVTLVHTFEVTDQQLYDQQHACICALAETPFSQLLIAGTCHGAIGFRDLNDRENAPTFFENIHQKEVTCLALASSNNQMASSGVCDNVIRVWDINKQAQVASIEMPPQDMYPMTYALHGRYLVTGLADGSLLITDMWKLCNKNA